MSIARVVACLMTVVVIAGEASASWEWANPSLPRVTLHRLLHYGSTFVVVGNAGLVATSGDGARWSVEDTPTRANLYDIDLGAGRYVAVGDGVVLSGSSPHAWELVVVDPDLTLVAVDYGAGRFVAGGAGLDGAILTSTDGVSWAVVATGIPGPFEAVLWTGDRFFAAAGADVYTSDDGLAWQLYGTTPWVEPTAETTRHMRRFDLAWTGSALLWSGGSDLYRTQDGLAWDLVLSYDVCLGETGILGLWAANNVALAAGFTACANPVVQPLTHISYSATDGAAWEDVLQEDGWGISAVLRAGTRWVGVGAGGDTVVSSNGRSWSCPGAGCTSAAPVDRLRDLAVGVDRVVGVGAVRPDDDRKRLTGGTVAIREASSPWTVAPSETEALVAATFTGEEYVAIGRTLGQNLLAYRSADGLDWLERDLQRTTDLRSLVWAEDLFVAVGANGALLTSPDGDTWSEGFTGVDTDLNRVEHDGDLFFAVGAAGTILFSRASYVWNDFVVPTSADLWGVAFDGARHIAVGDDGTVIAESVGGSWTVAYTGTAADLRDVVWDGERFVAVGFDDSGGSVVRSVVAASSDGDSWTVFRPRWGAALDAIADAGGSLVAVGGDRTLLETVGVGTLLRIEPEPLVLVPGETREVEVVLDEVATAPVEIALDSLDPQRVVVPTAVTVATGADSATVPVQALRSGGSGFTASVPESLGGGRATARVVITAPPDQPRRPSGRRAP